MDNRWLQSIYTDGTAQFVSNPLPTLGEDIEITLRIAEASPVEHVILRNVRNGGENLLEMTKTKTEDGLTYYSAKANVNERVFRYHFYILSGNTVYYYTQRGITTYIPDITYDFRILADYEMPEWVRGAVFYQIFPDRFCNGDPANDVQDGEYIFDGHPTIRVKDWNEAPKEYPEVHCLDFYGGDLQGIIQKIPYLKKLGVTAIYLNPIFFAATVHKYDCLDYFHVDPHFGGDEALAALSEALHREGMKLMLDVSINHTGIAHKWFNRDGSFFPKSVGAYNNPDAPERKYYFFKEGNQYKAWWDVETLPTLNYTSQALRDILYVNEDSMVKKWLKAPYSIDGWRFDVADVMAKCDEIQLSHEVWTGIRQSIKDVNPQAYILAEDWGDCSEYLQGTEWDSPMNYYGFGRCARQFCGEIDLFSARNPYLNKIRYRMTAEDFKERIMEHLSKLPYVIQEVQFNLFDSHDTPRLHNDDAVSQGSVEAMAKMMLAMPGAANIYYGDELNADGHINTNEGCRYPMPWNKVPENERMFGIYSTLAHLKAESAAIREGGFRIVYAEGYTIAFVRMCGREAYLFVWSREDGDRNIRIPLDVLPATVYAPKEDVCGEEMMARVEGKDLLIRMPADVAFLAKISG